MAIFTPEELTDLVATTRKHPAIRKNSWTNLMTGLQRYVVGQKILKSKRKKVIDSGTSVDFKAQVNAGVNFAMSGLHDTDDLRLVETMITGNVPFRFMKWGYYMDVREDDFNKGSEKILDYMKTREAAEEQGAADGIENQFFSKPADSSDTTSLWGLFYWIKYVAGTPSFQGGNPVGFSSGAGGIDSASYTRWQNWTGDYTNFTDTDLVDKFQDATFYTDFISPIGNQFSEVKDPEFDLMILCNWASLKEIKKIAKSQNESLGFDLDAVRDKVTFQGTPFVVASKLGDGSITHVTNPFIGIDFSTFFPFVKRGEWMRKTTVGPTQGAHNRMENWTDCCMNIICDNRRRQWILGQAA